MSQEYKSKPVQYCLKNVAVISMKDLRKAVVGSLTPILKDNLVEFLNDNPDDSDWLVDYFTSYHPKNFNNKDVISWWCDICSEKFFEDNHNIDEVIVDLSPENGGQQNKEWLASRI